MPPPLSIQELYQIKNKRRAKEKQRFQKVIELVHMRIRAAAKLDRMHCLYEIPIFLPGMPLYDRGECMAFVMESLQAGGFQVGRPERPTSQWELFISWDPSPAGASAPPSGPVSGQGPAPAAPLRFRSFL